MSENAIFVHNMSIVGGKKVSSVNSGEEPYDKIN